MAVFVGVGAEVKNETFFSTSDTKQIGVFLFEARLLLLLAISICAEDVDKRDDS